MCNIVDIRKQSNYEIAVRISTDINNQGREFYTDLNGFQVLEFYHFISVHIELGFDFLLSVLRQDVFA